MQCSSCRFENMPGVDVCGRCGSSLRLATAVLDVHPPRARPWAKRLRRYLPLHAASARLRDVASEVSRQVSGSAETVRFQLPAAGIITESSA